MRFFLIFLLFVVYLNGKTIRVAVSANVSYAIEELKEEFKRLNPNINLEVILGSTGKLTAQIRNNAPYHIFMAANMGYPKSLYRDGFAITVPLVYAKGSLAVLSTQKRDLSDIMGLLKSDKIKRIAVANPMTAPYGIATKEALERAGVYDEIKSKFVYGESISQTVIYANRVADLGFVSKSSLFSSKMTHFKEGENWVELNPKFYTPISQGVVILKDGENNPEVSTFFAFIFSKRAREIFKKFGYLVLEEK